QGHAVRSTANEPAEGASPPVRDSTQHRRPFPDRDEAKYPSATRRAQLLRRAPAAANGCVSILQWPINDKPSPAANPGGCVGVRRWRQTAPANDSVYALDSVPR